MTKLGGYIDDDENFKQYIDLKYKINGLNIDFPEEKIYVIFTQKEKSIKLLTQRDNKDYKEYKYIIVFTEQLKGQKL